MGPKTKQLISVLDEIMDVLESDGEAHWKKWIALSRSRLLDSDYSGIEHLLSAYGGMGSFADFASGKILEKLSNNAYELAIEIKHQHEVGDA